MFGYICECHHGIEFLVGYCCKCDHDIEFVFDYCCICHCEIGFVFGVAGAECWFGANLAIFFCEFCWTITSRNATRDESELV